MMKINKLNLEIAMNKRRVSPEPARLASAATVLSIAVLATVYATSRGRWRRYEADMAPVQDLLRPFVEAFGYADDAG